MEKESNTPQSTADLAYGSSGERRRDTNTAQGDGHTPLLQPDKTAGFSNRWQDLQTKFVDQPKDAVREADGLVAEVIKTLATNFADQRKSLEDQWSQGSEVSTEDLRQALMQYRSFFQRLLAA